MSQHVIAMYVQHKLYTYLSFACLVSQHLANINQHNVFVYLQTLTSTVAIYVAIAKAIALTITLFMDLNFTV